MTLFHRRTLLRFVGAVTCLLFAGGFGVAAAAAKSLPQPTGQVILTIFGNIERTNRDGRAELDREMLEALGLIELDNWTPFTDGQSRYRGILARDLLALVGAEGRTVEASALDMYTMAIPLADLQSYDVLIAIERDGKPLSRRGKGPAWIVYPFATNPELNTPDNQERCVWQLVELNVQV